MQASRAAVVAASLVLWGLLAIRLRSDLAVLTDCDTTYLYQGYEPIPLPARLAHPRYSLIKFADKDPRLAHVPRPQHAVPVLFVHGHLGSHQQMRSLASETGRELRRRLSARVLSPRPFWLDWYAPDFNAQPSALESHLLVEQANFVAGCILHLRQQHLDSLASSQSGQAGQSRQSGQSGQAELGQQAERPRFRLVVVGYSMGGDVARLALWRLQALDPGFDMSSLVLLLRLASPQHFPAFMPAPALRTAAAHTAPAASAAGAAGTPEGVPTVTVLAGRGDHMLADTHVLAALVRPGELAVGMQDVPGVWTTTSHKGAVSCNQLVRTLAPLLVDAVAAALRRPANCSASASAGGGSASASDASVSAAPAAAAAAKRLTTGVAGALGRGTWCLAGSEAAAQAPDAAVLDVAGGPVAAELEASDELTVARLASGQRQLSLRWHPAEDRAGLLLLASAARPGRTLFAAAGGRELSGAAAALPPLLPRLQRRHVPRDWQQLMAGVDWLHNATQLLWLPFPPAPAATRQEEQLATGGSIQVTLARPTAEQEAEEGAGSGGGATEPLLIAQTQAAHPLDAPAWALPPPEQARTLPPGHPMLLRLRLPPYPPPPLGASNNSDGASSDVMTAAVVRLLLSSSPPWSLQVRAMACRGGAAPDDLQPQPDEAGQEFLDPAVLALDPGSLSSRSGAGSLAGGGRPQPLGADGVRRVSPGGGGVPLWELVPPGPPAAQRELLLVSDPRCSYSLRLEWSFGAWLSQALRRHVYALPSLAIAAAACQLPHGGACSSRRGAPKPAPLVLPLLALLAAWGSQRPQLTQRLAGLSPWAELCAVEAGALVLAAWGAAAAVGAGAACCVGALQRLAARRGWCPLGPAATARVLFAASAAGVVHAAAPLAVAAPALVLRAATAGRDRQQALTSWLAFYCLLSLLPATQLVGWLLNGSQYSYPWSMERLWVLLLAAHATAVGAQQPRSSELAPWRQHLGAAARSGVQATAALAAGAAGLWGYPFVALYAGCCVAATDVALVLAGM